MKLLKKFMSLLFVVALAFSMVTNVFATSSLPTGSATITVNNIVQDSVSGDGSVDVTAYKIVEYDTTTDSWVVASWVTDNRLTITNPASLDADELQDIIDFINSADATTLASLSSYITSLTAIGDTSTIGNDTVQSFSATLTSTAKAGNAGSYLIIVTDTTTEYNPMVATVGITEGSSAGTLVYDTKNSTITAKYSSTNIDKTATDATKVTGSGSDLAIGDVVYFTVTTKIPTYTTGSTVTFKIEDVLSVGLTYNGDAKVEIGDTVIENVKTNTGSTNYITYNSGTRTITVDLSSLAVENSGKQVTFTYSATLNEDATTNFTANENTATLTYTTDSGETSISDKTYHYTFEIDGIVYDSITGSELIKVGENEYQDESKTIVNALEGAEFMLYTYDGTTYTPVQFADYDEVTTLSNGDSVEGYYVKNASTGLYELTTDTEYNSTSNTTYYKLKYYSSDSNGLINIKGLDAGVTYYLKEVSAPEGYTVSSTVVPIVITAEYNTDGTLKSYTVNVNGAQSGYSATYTNIGTGTTIEVQPGSNTSYLFKNTTVAELPSTGGMGTMVFTIIGCGLMIAAAAAFLVSRRRREEKE